jgi:hypothetical protein
MTERARDPHAYELVLPTDRLHGSADADDGVELEQGHRRGRALEADGAVLNSLHDRRGERIRIHFESHREGGSWIDGALDDVVHVERVGPERLIAKRLEAKDGLATRNFLLIELVRRNFVRGAEIEERDTAPDCDHGRQGASQWAAAKADLRVLGQGASA